MKLHYAKRFGLTACGMAVDLYYNIEVTDNPGKVTCRRCLKTLKK